jgi:hypothetical protein
MVEFERAGIGGGNRGVNRWSDSWGEGIIVMLKDIPDIYDILACDAVSFRGVHRSVSRRCWIARRWKVCLWKTREANDVALILSVAIDTGERSNSCPDGVPQQTNTTVDIKA